MIQLLVLLSGSFVGASRQVRELLNKRIDTLRNPDQGLNQYLLHESLAQLDQEMIREELTQKPRKKCTLFIFCTKKLHIDGKDTGDLSMINQYMNAVRIQEYKLVNALQQLGHSYVTPGLGSHPGRYIPGWSHSWVEPLDDNTVKWVWREKANGPWHTYRGSADPWRELTVRATHVSFMPKNLREHLASRGIVPIPDHLLAAYNRLVPLKQAIKSWFDSNTRKVWEDPHTGLNYKDLVRDMVQFVKDVEEREELSLEHTEELGKKHKENARKFKVE